MILWRALGMAKEPVELPAEAREKAVVLAMGFLACGGVVTLGDWRDMGPEEVGVLQEAGRRLELDRAVRFGLAAQGGEALARLRAQVDGGDTATDLVLRMALEKAAWLLEGKVTS